MVKIEEVDGWKKRKLEEVDGGRWRKLMVGEEEVDGWRKRNCGPRTADCGLWTADCGLRTAPLLQLLVIAGVAGVPWVEETWGQTVVPGAPLPEGARVGAGLPGEIRKEMARRMDTFWDKPLTP